MYKGDGSYKQGVYSFEISLLDLITKEDEQVESLNEAYRAYNIAKKSGIRLGDYEQTIKYRQEELLKTRVEIKEYCEQKLNIKTNLADNKSS